LWGINAGAFCRFSGAFAEMRFQPFRPGSWWRGRAADNKRPNLAIVTCIKNEGEDLVEWLCFHRLIGVSRFVIYDNLSTDATLKILDAVPFRDEIDVHTVADESAQKVAFRDAIDRYRGSLDWVAFLDADEFIVPLGEASLLDKLAEFQAKGIDGLGIHWRIFGSSGRRVRPQGLVTRSFTRRAGDDFPGNRHVKSIVRLPAVKKMVTQHYFTVRGKYLLDNGSEAPPAFEGLASEPSYTQGFAIHHYITKSHAQCMKKIVRGRPKPSSSKWKYRPVSYWTTYDRNEVKEFRAAQVIAPIQDDVLRLRDEIEAQTRRAIAAAEPVAGSG
jgi:glycosyltransferase involved in cell wall biosynthesis